MRWSSRTSNAKIGPYASMQSPNRCAVTPVHATTRVAATAIASLSLMACLMACATNAGPRTIPGARFDYNERLSQSTNDQVLLNLVRLRYRDTPYFLEVGSVLVQYQITGRVAVTGSTAPAASPSATAGLELDREVDERPTIT